VDQEDKCGGTEEGKKMGEEVHILHYKIIRQQREGK